jgi:hypothetical protein
MKSSITRRKAFFAGAVLAAAAVGVPLAWSGGLLSRSDDPARSARLALRPDKADRLAHAQRIRAEAHARAANHRKPDPVAARPEPTPDPLPPTGIVPITPPFPAESYTIHEQGWQAVQAGKRIAVYAGALTADRAQGLVIVEVASLPKPSAAPTFTKPGRELQDDQTRLFTRFPTPTREGAVEIVGAQGQRLTLKAESGKILVFDVRERGWVSG